MIFKKEGIRNRINLRCMNNDTEMEILEQFNYLGIVGTTGGSFVHAYETQSG